MPGASAKVRSTPAQDPDLQAYRLYPDRLSESAQDCDDLSENSDIPTVAQVGEKLAGHLHAVQEKLSEQPSCGHPSGLAPCGLGRLRRHESLLGGETQRGGGLREFPGRCAVAR
jgi:hypothetical protein